MGKGNCIWCLLMWRRLTIDFLEKAYNRLPKKGLWRCLEKTNVPFVNIRVIRNRYERVKMRLRMLAEETEDFHINIPALSPFIFTLVCMSSYIISS